MLVYPARFCGSFRSGAFLVPLLLPSCNLNLRAAWAPVTFRDPVVAHAFRPFPSLLQFQVENVFRTQVAGRCLHFESVPESALRAPESSGSPCESQPLAAGYRGRAG